MIKLIGGKCTGRAPVCVHLPKKLFLAPLAALAVTLLALAPAVMEAQSAEDAFRGTWQIQTPDQGALILLLKNQGVASYFWGDNADRTVYPGSWSHAETLATVNWKDGSSHLIEKTASGLTVTHRNAAGERSYSAPAQQIPQELLGQWAKPPTREDDMRSARDEAKGFFGTWKIADTGQYILVEPDRATASNIGDGSGQRGQWAKQGSELHIIWDSGRYGILRENGRGFDYKQVESGEIIEDDQTKAVAISRTIESKVPSAWLSDYQAERRADADGLAFSSRQVARNFYRGDWIVRRGERTFEQIEFSRFGGLKTSRDRSLSGQWNLSGQDMFLRWDDGIRQVLSPVGRGFILYAYRPGRPLDGVPTQIYAAAPVDPAKLTEHLEGRKDVVKQMQELAAAAGIDPASQPDVGWGRTFARWAWPFSDSSGAMSSGQILDEEFAPESASDPWWWPFWSEQARTGTAQTTPATDAAGDGSTTTAPKLDGSTAPGGEDASQDSTDPAPDSESATPAAKPQPSPARRHSQDWFWPF